MAHPKKGALHQVLVPMVDSVDFASIESGITASDFNSGATLKWYGLNTGGSAATTSGTVSKTASLVRSGVFRITLKTTENNYDAMMLRVNKTGCAEQILVWSNVDNDDSDIMSMLTAISGLVSDAHSAAILGASHASDAHSAATLGASRALLIQSRLSDLDSRLVSDLSDVLSQLTVVQSAASDAASAAAQGNSRILVVQSRLSDLDSRLVSDVSDIRSMLTALSDAISDAHSDLGSKIGGVTATLGASDISDIASAVWANTIGARVDSRVLLVQSRLSDFDSRLVSDISDLKSAVSDLHSDLASKIGNVSVTLTASDISDIASAVAAAGLTISASDMSDIASRVDVVLASRLSDILSAAQQANSRVLVVQSLASDAHSAAVIAQLDASDLSDIASAVWAAKYTAHSAASTFGSLVSDVFSRVVVIQSMASDAHSAATVGASRALLNQSRISDVYSLLSDLSSDFASRVPGNFSDTLSDILVAADAAASRALLVQSRVSDIQSALAAGVEIGASSLSDLRSAVTAVGVTRAGADITAVPGVTATLAEKVDWMFALTRNRIDQTATQQKAYNDGGSQIASAAVSDDGTTFTRAEWAG